MAKNIKKKVRLALFDIDGTIFRSSLLIEFINGLVEGGIFPLKARKEIETAHLAWLDRIGHYDDYLMSVVKVHLKYIKKCHWLDIEKVVEKIISRQHDRVYRYTRDLIKKLNKKKYLTVAVSGSPAYMVSRFAKHMKFSHSFGQILEIKDGKFTGKIINKDFRNKQKTIESFVSSLGINVDWKNSVAVGDTDNDIPMLKMVGRPIAFNPNASFAKYAKKNGWEIVVERKDAIFRLKDFEV